MAICMLCMESDGQTFPELPNQRFCGCNVHHGRARVAKLIAEQKAEEADKKIADLEARVAELEKLVHGFKVIKVKNPITGCT